MGKYDFTFIYEVKNREFENDCLIAYELQKRGYKVGFVETWDQLFYVDKPIDTKVAICFSLYNDLSLKYVRKYTKNCKKYVNMQCEQVLTNSAVKEVASNGSFNGINGKVREVQHISWGENNKKRITEKYHIPERNICLAGHVTLDFLRPLFAGYYETRSDLLHEYGIDSKNKIVLFISSFTTVGFPEEYMKTDMNSNSGFNINSLSSISALSQKEILMWFEKVLQEDTESVVIYRPHPTERNNPFINNLASKYVNFYVIEDYSVKQWITISDKIYTWESTAIAEIYAANKSCYVLRPCEIPESLEMEIYNGAKCITDFNDFKNSFYSNKESFPIEKEIFSKYYHISETPSYILIADYLEEVYRNNDYAIETNDFNIFNFSFFRFIRNLTFFIVQRITLSNFLERIFKPILRLIHLDRDTMEYFINMREKNSFNKTEYEQVMKKLKEILK